MVFFTLFVTAAYEGTNIKVKRLAYYHKRCTLEYGIDVGQGISVGPGRFLQKE